MHARDRDGFVIGAVEHADEAALGRDDGGAPEKVVRELKLARLLERLDGDALRVDAGEEVRNRAVFS